MSEKGNSDKLKHQPLKTYNIPKYPKKELFVYHPELLLKHAPPQWLRSSLAAGSLVAFVSSGLLQMSCKNAAKSQDSAPGENKVESVKANEVEQEQVKIAPLFIHGDGIGAIGCVITTPPTFLSEAEALDVICSALKKENIEFDQKDWLLEDFFTEEKREDLFRSNDSGQPDSTIQTRHPFYFDAYNSKLNMGIKFVSHSNYFDLGGVQSSSSVTDFDMIKVAQEIKEELQDFRRVQAVIFYDPVIVSRGALSFMDISDTDKAEARRLLSEQVSDFIKWFKEKTGRPK